jgi:hypothetical protein
MPWEAVCILQYTKPVVIAAPLSAESAVIAKSLAHLERTAPDQYLSELPLGACPGSGQERGKTGSPVPGVRGDACRCQQAGESPDDAGGAQGSGA